MESCEKMLFRELKNTQLLTRRIPISGGIELTGKCNLNCVHCYEKSDINKKSLDTKTILRIIDELVDEEALSVYLTGGEAMIRKDFDQIYKYIKEKGLIVAILSNGTTVDDDKINLFNEYPPFMIDISIYGACEDTYYKVTGVKNIFETFISCLDRLKNNHIPFNLKTVLMKENVSDLEGMKKIAEHYCVPFKFFTDIRPRNDGNKTTQEHCLTIEEALLIESSDKNLSDFYREIKDSDNSVSERKIKCNKYLCKIAQNGFFITHDGFLHGCVRERNHGYDLKCGTFSEGWSVHCVEKLINPVSDTDFKCRNCDSMKYCDYCPGQFEIETGNPCEPPDRICTMAKARKAMFS
jgi:MoaA/NifB/PqqE/SkfB family radical SAM enzyme